MIEASQRLQDVAADRSMNEAKLLLTHSLGINSLDLITNDIQITDEQKKIFNEVLVRRARHEPIAYIIGEKEFYGRRFFVEPSVLIPRPETEILLQFILELFPSEKLVSALEIGTGSGCLAISLALERPNFKIQSLEISEPAYQVALKNKLSLEADRLKIILGDSRDLVKKQSEKIDLLFSNPPYIPDEEFNHLPIGIRGFEPEAALRAGPAGMMLYEHIFRDWSAFVKKGGYIVLETFDQTQRNKIREAFPALDGEFSEEDCLLIWKKNH